MIQLVFNCQLLNYPSLVVGLPACFWCCCCCCCCWVDWYFLIWCLAALRSCWLGVVLSSPFIDGSELVSLLVSKSRSTKRNKKKRFQSSQKILFRLRNGWTCLNQGRSGYVLIFAQLKINFCLNGKKIDLLLAIFFLTHQKNLTAATPLLAFYSL